MNKFAFLVNPAGAEDMDRFPFSGPIPKSIREILFRLAPPVKLAEFKNIESSLGKTGGFLISVPITSSQINKIPHSVLARKIIRAARMAKSLGAGLIGLGEFAPLLSESIHSKIIDNLGVAVAKGLRYTLFAGLQSVLDAAALLGHDLKKAHVVVLDAAGPVGSSCALLLAGGVMNMTLVDKEKRKLTDLAGKILFESGLSVRTCLDDRRAIRTAHIVVRPQGRIENSDLQPGAVVYNIATPPGEGGITELLREDVLTVEGALIKMPGTYSISSIPGLPPGMVCPSMAETIVLAIEGHRENYWPVNELTVVQIRKMAILAEKHGFKISGIRGLRSPLTLADVEKVKDCARKKGFCEYSGELPAGRTMLQ